MREEVCAAREAPAIAVQPAGFVSFVRVATKGAHSGAVIALERAGEVIADCWVAGALKIDKEDGTAEHGCEEICTLAGEIGHGSRTARGCERKEELALGLEGGEPYGERMRRAGTDDDDVSRIEWALGAVGVDNGDLGPGLERDARAGREGFVDFDSDYLSLRAGKLCKNGGVIARPATEMKNMIAGANVEQAEMKCPQTGLSIVQALGRVEHDEGVTIDIAWIGAFGEVLCAAGLNHPGTGANEALAEHGGEGVQNGRRGDVIDAAQFLGIEMPRGFDRIGR